MMEEADETDKFARELLKIQYSQLGESIKATRERIHQITLTATIGLPASLAAAKALDLGSLNAAVSVVVCIMPIVFFAFFMFYIAERQAIKRYGLYIAEVIDPLMKTSHLNSVIGWHSAVRDKPVPLDKVMADTSDYDDARTVGFGVIILCYSFTSIVISAFTFSSYIIEDRANHGFGFSILFIFTMATEMMVMFFTFERRASIRKMINIFKFRIGLK